MSETEGRKAIDQIARFIIRKIRDFPALLICQQCNQIMDRNKDMYAVLGHPDGYGVTILHVDCVHPWREKNKALKQQLNKED